jgi:hypothetical protein
MTILIACDEPYYIEAQQFLDSLDRHWKGHKSIFCIGFDPVHKRNGYKYASCEIEKIKSYHPEWPNNRKFYVCAEGGEFLDFFKMKDEEILIHVDADMIMQRKITVQEMNILNSLEHGQIAGSYYSKPPHTLREEFWKLSSVSYYKAKEVFPNHWDRKMFCAGLVACTVKTYREVIKKHYLGTYLNDMRSIFRHHAAGQWIMNYLTYEHGQFIDLGSTFHNATWFLETDTSVKDRFLYHKKEKVLFNHTKFDGNWRYK